MNGEIQVRDLVGMLLALPDQTAYIIIETKDAKFSLIERIEKTGTPRIYAIKPYED